VVGVRPERVRPPVDYERAPADRRRRVRCWTSRIYRASSRAPSASNRRLNARSTRRGPAERPRDAPWISDNPKGRSDDNRGRAEREWEDGCGRSGRLRERPRGAGVCDRRGGHAAFPASGGRRGAVAGLRSRLRHDARAAETGGARRRHPQRHAEPGRRARRSVWRRRWRRVHRCGGCNR
jgi:hypothetical protein